PTVFTLLLLFYFHYSFPLPHLHSFPTRRSSDLQLRSGGPARRAARRADDGARTERDPRPDQPAACTRRTRRGRQLREHAAVLRTDRKSTRLNSSHVKISYAVFCLKKKNRLHNNT